MIEYVELERGDGKSVLIGSGLGHGFYSKENDSGVAYLLNSSYSPENEYGISPKDPELNIAWPNGFSRSINQIVSTKDLQAPTLKERQELGELPRL